MDPTTLMDEALRRENLTNAMKRVVKNDGAPGTDGMHAKDLEPYLHEHWPSIKADLLSDRYKPKPVRKVEIPKPDGKGKRMLGIPCVLDRFVQQAIQQVLQPIFDPTFSESSFGYRPGRNAQQAVSLTLGFVQDGHGWVVDIDLEKFFDRVNHDVLMARVARRVKDKQILRLIRRFLQAGIMEGGVVSRRVEGTPQGSPLSPLLSNILLDELDKELERRGHHFARYADDCNIYVRTERAGVRVLASVEEFLRKRLRLKVNREKSAVARPWYRSFLGYSVTAGKKPRLRVSPKAIRRLKGKVRKITHHGRGKALTSTCEALNRLVYGWAGYYRLAQTPSVFQALDGWIRRRLRCVLWRQWKRPRTRVRKLLALGANPVDEGKAAWQSRGPWRHARSRAMHTALTKRFFHDQGLTSLAHACVRLQQTT